ncbi:MAG: PIN domain-containing protein [Actinomycetes bacterium]
MRVIIDSGVLIALERSPRPLTQQFDALAARSGHVALVPATVVAQVWRTGSDRQAPLAAFLSQSDIDPLSDDRARAVGRLLAASGTNDIADAHVVEAALSGDVVFTSDPVDIARLAHAAGKQLAIVAV